METTISGLNGKKLNDRTLTVPSSKSHTIRALLIASFADGESLLINPLDSADARSCIAACREFGAEITTGAETAEGLPMWKVSGTGGRMTDKNRKIDAGNSGTTLYLAAGFAALSGAETEFTGDDQIRKRPVKPLLAAFSDLGAEVDIEGTSPPFRIRGPLRGGETSIECPTSQYLSSLLLSAPLAAPGSVSIINVPLLMEKPYVEITLRWLDRQGIKYGNKGFSRFTVPGGQRFTPFSQPVPGDFSSAAFPLCAAAITASRITLAGLDTGDSQGDKAVIGYLQAMGCRIIPEKSSDGELISVEGPGRLKSAELDLNDTPDALPAMAATACFAEGTTRLYNVPQARLKETDRISVMAMELGKMGADIEETEDGLTIRGGRRLKGCRLDGHGDHRVVMALSVAALGAEGRTTITGSEAVDITYPDFFKHIGELHEGI